MDESDNAVQELPTAPISEHQITPTILKFFGLKQLPFSLSPNPRYFYLDSQHEAILAKIIYMVENRQGLSLIVGDIGSGKTSLSRLVFNEYADKPEHIVKYVTNPHLNTKNQFLRLICDEFGIPTTRDFYTQLKNFQAYLGESYEKKLSPILIIDEAQVLKGAQLELIRQILNYETDRSKLIQILLFGQSEIHNRLRLKKNVKSRIATYANLDAITLEGTKDLINFRVNVAGRQKPLFTDEAINEIYKVSKGNPRATITICLNSIPLAFRNNQDTIDQGVIKEAIGETIYEQR